MNPIFVYGTLKRGGRYHSYLAGQQFLTTACTIAGHTLYQPADYPAMVLDQTDRNGVSGEVWQVNAACLQALDQLEGVHEHLYARMPVKLAPPHAGLIVESYFYLVSGRKLTVLKIGRDFGILPQAV